MSGALAGVIGGIGFARGLLSGVLNANPRLILVPVTNAAGQQIKSKDGQGIYQAFNTYIALNEDHYDEMTITDHPVEQGSTISDHAYKMPARLTMRMGWSPSTAGTLGVNSLSALGVSLPTFAGAFGFATGAGATYIKEVYAELLTVQASAALCVIFTGKRIYQNMLIQSIQETTTNETENALILSVVFREIILVSTHAVANPVNNTANAAPQDLNASHDIGNMNGAPATALNPTAAASAGVPVASSTPGLAPTSGVSDAELLATTPPAPPLAIGSSSGVDRFGSPVTTTVGPVQSVRAI